MALEHLVARECPVRSAIWSARPPSPVHSSRRDRPRRDRVHEHALARPACRRTRAAERQLAPPSSPSRPRSCSDGRLPDDEADVHDPAAAALGHRRRERAHQPHRRHHVQLPLRLPVLVGELVERARRCSCRRCSRAPRARGRSQALRAARSPASGAVTSRSTSRAVARHAEHVARPPARACRAVAAPMPRVAPVTTHSLPLEPEIHQEDDPMKSHTVYRTFQHRAAARVRAHHRGRAGGGRRGRRAEGMALVAAMHITAGVWINDDEPGLQEDALEWLDKVAPPSWKQPANDVAARAAARPRRLPPPPRRRGQRRRPPEEPARAPPGDRPGHRRPPRPGPVAAGLLRRVRRPAAKRLVIKVLGRVDSAS